MSDHECCPDPEDSAVCITCGDELCPYCGVSLEQHNEWQYAECKVQALYDAWL